jgi:phosphoglycolate phosphatase
VAIRGILFDKDGTIVDYGRTWVPINRLAALHAAGGNQALAGELLRLGGHDPQSDTVMPGTPLAAGNFEEIAAAFAAHPDVGASQGTLSAAIERIFTQGGAEHSELLPGARDTIRELKRRGFAVGLATNDTIGGLRASLAKHDILQHFDFEAGCDSGFGSKPDPRMVQAFCRAMRLDPREVAVVGDAVHDLAMARAAGAGLVVGVLCGTSRREDLQDLADLILPTINALLVLPQFISARGS